MTASARAGTRWRAGLLAAATVLLVPPVPASAVTDRAAAFDEDPFSLSSSGASAGGSVSWSRGSAPRVVRAQISGDLRQNGDGCARLSVSWLNSGNSTIGSESRRVCDGESTGFGFSFGAAGLECVRIRLAAGSGGPSRVLCAGGS